jgi:hypothetical protein
MGGALRITGRSFRLTGGSIASPAWAVPSGGQTVLLANEDGDTLTTESGDTLELEA